MNDMQTADTIAAAFIARWELSGGKGYTGKLNKIPDNPLFIMAALYQDDYGTICVLGLKIPIIG